MHKTIFNNMIYIVNMHHPKSKPNFCHIFLLTKLVIYIIKAKRFYRKFH